MHKIYTRKKGEGLHEFLEDREFLKQLSQNAFDSNYKLDGSYEVARYLEEVAKSEKLQLSIRSRLMRFLKR